MPPHPACAPPVRLTFLMAMIHSLSRDCNPQPAGTAFPPDSAVLQPCEKAAVEFIEGQIPDGGNRTSHGRVL
jgi:hypothetical protein